MNELKELLFRLCRSAGTPGQESAAAETAKKEMESYMEVEIDHMGNVIGHMGDRNAQRHVMLDAHIDQIGMTVTVIDKDGFLHIAPCGGVDRRVLPGSPVTVFGDETLTGIVCCLPPHLIESGEEKVVPVDHMAVDVGMTKEKAEKLVRPGDRIAFCVQPRSLLGSRVTAAGLDDRAGCAVLIRTAQLLHQETLNCALTILLSSREETGAQGARTAAYQIQPTEAIIVDVSFGRQPGVEDAKSGKLSAGPMLGIAPSLDRAIGKHLSTLAKEKEIPVQYEVMGGEAGTNADEIGVTRGGIPCAMLSIPQKNMHTPVEIVDLEDLENTAKLIAEYVRRCD